MVFPAPSVWANAVMESVPKPKVIHRCQTRISFSLNGRRALCSEHRHDIIRRVRAANAVARHTANARMGSGSRGAAEVCILKDRPGQRAADSAKDAAMPLYEYECTTCHRRIEKIQKFSDAELTVCPHCGGKLERTITAAAVSFKGGGWFKDGYGSVKPAASGGDAAAATGSQGGGPAAGEKAPTAGAAETAKPAAAPATAPAAAPAAATSSKD
jgi:putative FmdB family regulatory protein